jgi:hypothetical protein
MNHYHPIRRATSLLAALAVNRWKPGAVTRHLILLSALLAALSLAFTGTASAQTSFQASVTFTGTLPAGPCANGAYLCGTANIAGYGAATWDFYTTSSTGVYSRCGSTYTATTYFTLVSDPGSTLVVDESGSLCGLGHDGSAYRGYFNEGSKAFGHPFEIVGSWAIDSASGQFAGLTGSGTDQVHVAGAHAAGSYTSTLGP